MVAYSFKQRFVDPIRIGLGIKLGTWPPVSGWPAPKLQTIRANGKRRHARPGEKLQLYCGLRTKNAFLIGRARCTKTLPITIVFAPGSIDMDEVRVPGMAWPNLDAFARADGFSHWAELRSFWRTEHPGVNVFDGTIIFWKPIG